MRASRPRLVAVLLAALVLASNLQAQDSREPWRVLLDEWEMAATTHTPGEANPPVQLIAQWNPTDLEALFVHIRAAVRAEKTGRLAKAGAMLHTDIAIFARVIAMPINRPRIPLARPRRMDSTPRLVVRAPDAQYSGINRTTRHWDFARALVDASTSAPAGDASVRAWYRATTAFLAEGYMYGELAPHLEHARRVFPGDAPTLFSSGCLEEALSQPSVQAFIRHTALPTGMRVQVDGERTQLQRAEGYFQRTLEIDPGFAEARVRLGRVLSRLGRHDDARRELRAGREASADAVVRFYAELFLGAVEEGAGRIDTALQDYDRAAALFPRAQSARLAISLLERRRGNREAAAAALEEALPHAIDVADDPWFDYYRGDGRDRAALFTRLHGLMSLARTP